MNPVLFALVDALLLWLQREHWRMRLSQEHRSQWEDFRCLHRWWRSTWVAP